MYDADIVGGAGRLVPERVIQTLDCDRERVDGVRLGKVGTTVTTGPRHPDAKPSTPQATNRDASKAGAVESDEFAAIARPGRILKQVADTPQVADPFLADVADEQQRAVERHPGLTSSPEQPESCNQTRPVVGDARKPQHGRVAFEFQTNVAGENRVQMGADDQRIRAGPLKGRDNVSDCISRGVEAGISQTSEEIGGPLGFLKRWCRNPGDPDLLLLDFSDVAAKAFDGGPNTRVKPETLQPRPYGGGDNDRIRRSV